MAIQGDGPWAVAVMWAVVAVTLIFVLLRIYTRAVVVASYGIDDHVYNLAFVSSLSSHSQSDIRRCDSRCGGL